MKELLEYIKFLYDDAPGMNREDIISEIEHLYDLAMDIEEVKRRNYVRKYLESEIKELDKLILEESE